MARIPSSPSPNDSGKPADAEEKPAASSHAEPAHQTLPGALGPVQARPKAAQEAPAVSYRGPSQARAELLAAHIQPLPTSTTHSFHPQSPTRLWDIPPADIDQYCGTPEGVAFTRTELQFALGRTDNLPNLAAALEEHLKARHSMETYGVAQTDAERAATSKLEALHARLSSVDPASSAAPEELREISAEIRSIVGEFRFPSLSIEPPPWDYSTDRGPKSDHATIDSATRPTAPD